MKSSLSFTRKTMMADVILSNIHLLPVVARFDMKYGFGSKTVEEVCAAYNVDVNFFLAIINSYCNPNYFPREQLQGFSVSMIVSYLDKTHDYYKDILLPEIEKCILKIEANQSAEEEANVMLLNTFVKKYESELMEHMLSEERDVFPYALTLGRVCEGDVASVEALADMDAVQLEEYSDMHENIEVVLTDLKNIIIRHLPPAFCEVECDRLLTLLFKLEEDLVNHALIERLVLVPMMKSFKKQILDSDEKAS